MPEGISTELESGVVAKDGSNVTRSAKNPNDSQRAGLGVVDHDVVRASRDCPESNRTARQTFPHVPAQWPVGQKSAGLVDSRFNAISGLRAVLGDVIPDFDQIIFRLRGEAVEAHP